MNDGMYEWLVFFILGKNYVGGMSVLENCYFIKYFILVYYFISFESDIKIVVFWILGEKKFYEDRNWVKRLVIKCLIEGMKYFLKDSIFIFKVNKGFLLKIWNF